MSVQRAHTFTIILVSISLVGCGTVAPNIKEAWDADIPGTSGEGGQKPRVPVAGAGRMSSRSRSRSTAS